VVMVHFYVVVQCVNYEFLIGVASEEIHRDS